MIGNRAASEKGFFGQSGTVLDVAKQLAKAQVYALYVTAGFVIRTLIVLELVYGPDIGYHDDNAA